jgi:nicotinamide-nucleotide adenylyltransferase
MNALYIGRFQPFHNGHLYVIKNLAKKYTKIIIGIGSSQYQDLKDNPFSAEERKLMIDKTLKNIDIDNYKIVLIPDIHDPPNWVNHVLSIYSDFEVIISNNDFTRELFSEKGFTVEKTPYYKKDIYSGKEIRRRIKNNESWEDLVPKPVYEEIMEIDGESRIKKIQKQ